MTNRLDRLWTTEDYRVVWLGLGIVLLALGACFSHDRVPDQRADLLTFGLKPFRAFTIGVAVDVPLEDFLSTEMFSGFRSNISSMM